MRDTTIDPGGSTSVLLSLPMGMHRGMDGPHVFRITVPIAGAGGATGTIALYLRANFH